MSEDLLKSALKKEKIIFGLDLTVKKLKNGSLKKVFVANNCTKQMLSDIEHYAKLAGVEIVKLGISSEEIGALCKKPFSVSVLSY